MECAGKAQRRRRFGWALRNGSSFPNEKNPKRGRRCALPPHSIGFTAVNWEKDRLRGRRRGRGRLKPALRYLPTATVNNCLYPSTKPGPAKIHKVAAIAM